MSLNLPFKQGQKVIEIGGGDHPLFHPNYDKRNIAGVDVICNLEERWPINDSSVDGVFGKFVGEHVGWRKAPHIFNEAGRVLRAGAMLVMILPNTLEQCREVARRNRITIEENALLYGGQEFEDNYHKCAYSPDYVAKLLTDAGLGNIHVQPLPNVPTDMVVDATKNAEVGSIVQSEWYRELRDSLGIKSSPKLNLGSFTVMVKDWLNIDVLDLNEYAKQNGYPFKQLDVRLGLPFPDKSIEAVVMSHLPEHLSRDDLDKLLKETLRVLKPEAPVRITVPSAMILAKAYINGKMKELFSYNEGVKNARDEAEAFWNMLTAGHLTAHDSESIRTAMVKAGFSSVEVTPPNGTNYEVIKEHKDMYPDHSAYIEGVSPLKAVSGKLRIALITPPLLRTPPDRYGGLEQVVYDLAVELAKECEVTVIAAKGSKVPGCNIIETLEPTNTTQVDWASVEMQAYNIYKDKLSDFDVVHDNTWLGFAYLSKRYNPKLKVLHTHHGHLGWRTKPVDKPNIVAISDWMVRVYAMMGWNAKRVYNGVDMGKYALSETERNNRMLFVGRLDVFKQPHIAIQVAKRLGLGLDIVGGSFVQDLDYLSKIKAQCDVIFEEGVANIMTKAGAQDDNRIMLHLDAKHEDKIYLMRHNKLLLFPSRMGEPFGLVAVEAMACGMPVIALNDGAISEVVQDGIQGRVVGDVNKPASEESDIDALVNAMKEEKIIGDATVCRARAETFSREIMASNYLKLYRDMLNDKEW